MTYTLAQIRQAGKEGEVNHLDVEHIIDLLKEQPNAEPVKDFKFWKERWSYIQQHNPGRSGNHIEDLINEFLSSQSKEVGQDADGQKEPLYRWQEIKIDDDLPKVNGIYETKDENGFVRQHFYDAAIPTKWRHLNPSLQRTENVVIRKSFITHWLCKVETPEQDESVCTHHYDFFAPNDSGNVVCKKCGKVL